MDEKTRPYKIYRKPAIFTVLRQYAWADIIYQNNIELRSLWPNILFRKPYVIAIRTWVRSPKGKKRIVDYLKRVTLMFAEYVISISDAIRKDSYKDSIIIGNPYRSNLFKIIDDIERRDTVAYLGRFVTDKGIELLIKAYSRTHLTNIPLTLIGSGNDETKYLKLANEVGIRLRLTGNLYGENLVKELNTHKILVIPSLWEEPFGNVALEGMACGCLVLASDGGGLPDAVGKAGLTFKRGCIDDLVQKIAFIYQNKNVEMNIRKHIKEHLSNHLEDVVCNKYLNVLERAYSNRKNQNQPNKY
ncbi:glycosyltransferase family 4 protein [Synechococcus sp. RS9902]|uniref:glycosyltransferase family 4 protein n=1 Tax=Synechococcus sp. RS9902 TaxID=221345 RepID=UPI001645A8A1|nr:glycosyltransferase family 4 protein [Synechococcus sp. RS9902]